MNLYQIRYFVTLARKEHYRLAAQELGITQPSLTHAIQALGRSWASRFFKKKAAAWS